MTKGKSKESTVNRIAKTARNVGSAIVVANKAFKIARSVAHMINVERKFYDIATTFTNTQFCTTGTISLLTGMAQGADYNQRNGNSIKAVSIQYRMNIFVGTTATGYRIILYKDNEPRQALPSVADILESTTTVSPMNHTNGKRFQILQDIHSNVDLVKNTMRVHKFYKKLNHHIKYVGSGSGITNTDEDNIYFLILADSSSGVTSPTAQFYSRLRYIDN